MNFLSNLFSGDGDEILFFILVFLLLFNGGNIFGIGINGDGLFDVGTILFFILVFLILFLNRGSDRDVA